MRQKNVSNIIQYNTVWFQGVATKLNDNGAYDSSKTQFTILFCFASFAASTWCIAARRGTVGKRQRKQLLCIYNACSRLFVREKIGSKDATGRDAGKQQEGK